MGEAVTAEETFRKLNKQFGGMSIKRLGELPPTKDGIVSTGIIGLDTALGIGGIKKGSIVEIYGPESGGKTTLALQMCKQYQKLDKPVLYIDTERTLTKETIESMGIKEKISILCMWKIWNRHLKPANSQHLHLVPLSLIHWQGLR